jgi:uncharacterized membrane protein
MIRKQIVTRFHLFLIGVLVAITATAYVKIPADSGLPVHWGFDGHPDRIWPRDAALLLFPIVGLLLTALFAAIGQFAAVERVEPGRHVAETMLTGLLGLLCALQFSLILIGIGSDIDMIRIISFAVAVIVLLLGIALPKSQPNAYAGIRLPWTVRNDRNWAMTHRLTGILLVVGGIGLALVAWLWPDPANLLEAMAAALLVPFAAGTLFSFVARRA